MPCKYIFEAKIILPQKYISFLNPRPIAPFQGDTTCASLRSANFRFLLVYSFNFKVLDFVGGIVKADEDGHQEHLPSGIEISEGVFHI